MKYERNKTTLQHIEAMSVAHTDLLPEEKEIAKQFGEARTDFFLNGPKTLTAGGQRDIEFDWQKAEQKAFELIPQAVSIMKKWDSKAGMYLKVGRDS